LRRLRIWAEGALADARCGESGAVKPMGWRLMW